MRSRDSNRLQILGLTGGALLASALACQSTPPPAQAVTPPDESYATSPAPDAESDTGMPQAMAPEDGTELSDEKVEAFARAYLGVVELEQKYTAEMQAAASPEEAESVQEQAQQEMQEVIENEGISLMEFEQIGTKAGGDEALRARVEEKMMQMQQPEAAR